MELRERWLRWRQPIGPWETLKLEPRVLLLGVGGGGDGGAEDHPRQGDRCRSSCAQDTDKLLPTASYVPVRRNRRKTHKGMNEGLQEVLGGGSGKSMDGLLLWGLLGQRNLGQGGQGRPV